MGPTDRMASFRSRLALAVTTVSLVAGLALARGQGPVVAPGARNSVGSAGRTGSSPAGEQGALRAFMPPAEPEASKRLIYARPHRLFDYELSSGRDRLVGRLPSADASATSSGLVAYLAPGGSFAAGGEVDFIDDPQLHVLDLDTLEVTDLGPGLSPSWSANGAGSPICGPRPPDAATASAAAACWPWRSTRSRRGERRASCSRGVGGFSDGPGPVCSWPGLGPRPGPGR